MKGSQFIAVIMCVAGGLLIWAGYKGVSPKVLLQGIMSGKIPTATSISMGSSSEQSASGGGAFDTTPKQGAGGGGGYNAG